ncbi:hypothetical protein BGZ76_007239 [Entomortierella beljakovae]|nr:hypothetical protein BGZ76_007239 [Entomortierella beljakovae]
MTWSIICTLVILNSFLSILSPSTAGGRALAALDPGFCGDCQTFANAIGVCGGSFGPADIEINGEYVLQQQYSKCVCTEVMQKVLWTCAKCELLAGHQSKAPPPQKYQTQCIAWGMTIEEWKAPYTGVVAPGTQTEVGGGVVNPPAPSVTNTPTNKPSQSATNGSGGSATSGGSTQPTNPSDNATSGDDTTTTEGSKPNTAAIGISVGIIGVAVVAGAIAVVMMKRRRRRRTPLDLDSLPGQAGGFSQIDDKWSPHRPQSPPLPPAPIASATPAVARENGHRSPYDNHGYMEGSVVGGYDGPYDGYDQYRGAAGPYNNGYGQGQYHNQYENYGQYEQDGYSQQEYNGYDQASQAPNYHSNTVKNEEGIKYL